MKINFTKKEYLLLLHMIFISDWIMYSHIAEFEKDDEYQLLRKKIFSFYKDMGVEDHIEYSKEANEYYEKFESDILEKYIDTYSESFFWEELIDRLAKRDAMRAFGIEQYRKLSFREQVEAEEVYKQRYVTEFETQGLHNVNVIFDSEVSEVVH